MRIAICEDLPEDAERLSALLRLYCAEHQLEAAIDRFSSADALLAAYHPGDYHILFLDVIMSGTSGIDAARRIRESDEEAAIIFTTISPNFAVDSYLLDAAFYLVKPVDPPGLEHAMRRCRHIVEQHARLLHLTQNKKRVDIRLKDILYLETRRNDRVIHARHGDFTTRISLSSLEQELGGMPFVRCHNSFIVNLQRVTDLDGRDFVLDTGERIPISKAYFAPVQELFTQYMFDEARGQSHSSPV